MFKIDAPLSFSAPNLLGMDKPEGQMSETAWVLQGLGSLAVHSLEQVPRLELGDGYHEVASSAVHGLAVLATTLHLLHRTTE